MQEDYLNKFQKYFDKPILDVISLKHKGNNKLFKITIDGEENLLKEYSSIYNGQWERGGTEYFSLDYLWNRGFRDIPRPIRFYKNENIGIYSFNKGEIIDSESIGKEDIFNAVDFLIRVHDLENEEKRLFSTACSACLCIQDYLDVIDKRLVNVVDYLFKEKGDFPSRTFLQEVISKANDIKENFEMKSKYFDLKRTISLDEQVLTPADFGFHNILKDNKKKYTFLDFEYFGRDDPARQILDFIHHDKSVGIKRDLKELFLEDYFHKSKKKDIEERIKILDPLVGMTWVLIPLNVLSNDYLKHIQFAHGEIGNILNERLKKSRLKLENISFFS
jgi:thiamine kinase-like enzyme